MDDIQNEIYSCRNRIGCPLNGNFFLTNNMIYKPPASTSRKKIIQWWKIHVRATEFITRKDPKPTMSVSITEDIITPRFPAIYGKQKI